MQKVQNSTRTTREKTNELTMDRFPLYVSSPPDTLEPMASLADGVEVKLNWEDMDGLLAGETIDDKCRTQMVDSSAIASIHLPPGTTSQHGMSIAPGSVGKVTDFVHRGIGTDVEPNWFTAHTTRKFDYREQIDRLGTISSLTGIPIAIENTPDTSYYYEPEELGLWAFLSGSIPKLSETYVLVDTAHVNSDRFGFEVDKDIAREVLERFDSQVRTQIGDEYYEYLAQNLERATSDVSEDDPWRPVLMYLYLVGGSRIRAIHLNDPVEDGLPSIGHDASPGLNRVLDFCRSNRVAVVLEPWKESTKEIEAVVEWLKNYDG